LDIGTLIQANAGLVGAIIGFLASQAVQIWRDSQAERRAVAREERTEGRAVAAESRADARALRDAKLDRLRRAFDPVLVAAWGVQTASSQFISSYGDPHVAANEIFAKATVGINEARAQLMLEENVRDVFDEFERVRIAFVRVRLEMRPRSTGAGVSDADAMIKAQGDIRDGVANIERLVNEHLRAVERGDVSS
jgi:hypothetical protein